MLKPSHRFRPLVGFLSLLPFISLGAAGLCGLSLGPAALGAEARRTTGTIEPGEQCAPLAYTIHDSGADGPTVMIVGGMHGNEPAGAAAAGQIAHWPVTRGRLIVLPRANPAALAAGKRNTPGAEPVVANLNRNFPSTAPSDRPRGVQAEAIWRFVKEQRPAWLLDLHEGYDYSQANKDSVGSSLIVYASAETQTAAEAMLQAVNATITDKTKEFQLRRSPIGGSLARSAAVQLGAKAMIVETTTKNQPVSLRIRQHRILVHRFLRHLDMLDDACSVDQLTPRRRAPGHTRVALYDAAGTSGRGVPRVLEILRERPDVSVERIGPPEIRAGVLDQFDVVLFTGGTGSGQAEALGEDGRREVKRFVERGGGYVGICAGAYLACSGFSWGLGILDARTKSPLWRRGDGIVEFEPLPDASEILGLPDEPYDVKYVNGPILEPAGDDVIPDYVTLARFGSELAENGTPAGIMVGSPAAVAGRFGRGRVLCFSPHPEQSAGLDTCVVRAIRWVSASRVGEEADPASTKPAG